MNLKTIDKITLNFEGWENVSLILGLILLITSYLLIRSAMKKSRINAFDYNIILEISLAIYTLILGLSRIVYYIRFGDSKTFFAFLIDLIFAARSFMIALMPVTTLIALGLIVSNIILLKKEGFSLSNLYAVLFSFIILAANILAVLLELYTIDLELSNEIKNLWYGIYSYLSCIYVTVIIWSIYLTRIPIKLNKDYLLILGCRVREDGTLYPLIKSRIDKALEFAAKQEKETGKKMIFVPTGGKGSDEQMSEAGAMSKYLLNSGIPIERIIAEEKSTTTEENMQFSKKLIECTDKNIAFATNNFHLFRSGILATQAGMKVEGIGSKTVWYYWPNAFMREFIGQMWELKKIYLIIFTIISVISVAIPQLIYMI